MTTQSKLDQINTDKDFIIEELQSFYEKKLTTENDLLDFQEVLGDQIKNIQSMIEDIESLLTQI